MEHESLLTVITDIDGWEEHPIKFKEYINQLKNSDNSYSTDTVVNYIRYLEKIDFDPLSSKPCPDIYKEGTSFHLSQFLDYAEKKANQRGFESSNSKVRFKYFLYIALRNYLEALDEDEKIEELPPSRKLQKPSSEPPVQAPEERHVKKLIKNEEDLDYQFAYQLLFYGGLRISEILEMKASWLTFDEDYIKIRIPGEKAKGSKQDVKPEHVFIPKKLSDDVKQQIKRKYDRNNDFEQLWDEIQTGEKEDLYLVEIIEDSEKSFREVHNAKQRFNRRLEKTAKEAEISWSEDFSSHRFRKGFVHKMKKKYGLSDAKELARHKSPETTQNHYLKTELEERGSKVEEAWS